MDDCGCRLIFKIFWPTQVIRPPLQCLPIRERETGAESSLWPFAPPSLQLVHQFQEEDITGNGMNLHIKLSNVSTNSLILQILSEGQNPQNYTISRRHTSTTTTSSPSSSTTRRSYHSTTTTSQQEDSYSSDSSTSSSLSPSPPSPPPPPLSPSTKRNRRSPPSSRVSLNLSYIDTSPFSLLVEAAVQMRRELVE